MISRLSIVEMDCEKVQFYNCSFFCVGWAEEVGAAAPLPNFVRLAYIVGANRKRFDGAASCLYRKLPRVQKSRAETNQLG